MRATSPLLALLALFAVRAFAADDWNVKNGSFTDGASAPEQWSKDGDGTLARDTEVYKSAPASLRFDLDGPGSGNAFQMTELAGARKFNIKGFIRSAGAAKAQAVVQCFDDKWARNEWKQLKFISGDTDWSSFDASVELPDWTARFRVMLHVDGPGKAWLDDVVIDGKPVEVASHTDPAKDEPTEGKPWEPGWCIYGWRAAWVGLHDGFVERSKKGDVDVVLWGDSITMGWGDRWKEPLAPSHVVNYGIGGDSTRQILWRVTHGEADGIHPKLVILAIGTNNLYADKDGGTDEEIAKGIETTLNAIREKLPAAKVLLVAMVPRQNEFFCNRIKHINSITEKLADGKQVRWLDMHSVFMKAEPGTVKSELFGDDLLHPNDRGYQEMMAVMKPVVLDMLK